MKRIQLLAAVAMGVITLASCSSDEVISSVDQNKAIGFDAMANKSSRTEVSTNNIERFRVFGCTMDAGTTNNHATIFNGITVKRPNLTSQNWGYENVQYWAPNKDYYFVAISTNVMDPKWAFTAPDTHPEGLATGDSFKGYGTVTMDVAAVSADNDLVYAYASRTTDAEITNTTKVPFSFNHMLSRLGLKFTNAIASTGYTIVISDVKITGIAANGSVELGGDPSALAWTMSTETASVTATVPSNNELVKDGSTTSAYKFIIPGSQAISIEFTATVKLNGTVYSTRTLNGTIAAKEYQPGKSYMLNASITTDNIAPGGAKPIEFTVTSVAGWGDDNNDDITLGN